MNPHLAVIPPQAIIFDIGRVIIRLDLERAFAPLAASWQASGDSNTKSNLTPERIWHAIQSDVRWRDWQEGRMSAQQWHAHIMQLLEIRLGFDDFCAAWNRVLDPRPILSDDLFNKLAATARLALLSNTDPLHVDYMETHFSFIPLFSERIYSCAVRLSKPSPAIYQAALHALQVPANRALYIDDVAEFADAARKQGIDSIQFQNPTQLLGELSQRAISVS